MTNTLHRQGAPDDLKHDYIIFVHTAAGKNREGSAPQIREFMRICRKYKPANMGDVKQGSMHQEDIEVDRLIDNLTDGTVAAAVFTDLDTLEQVVRELMQADLGICINITGLLDEVRECCRKGRDHPPQRGALPRSLGGEGPPARAGGDGVQHDVRPRDGLLQSDPQDDRTGPDAADDPQAGGPDDGQMLRVRRLQSGPGRGAPDTDARAGLSLLRTIILHVFPSPVRGTTPSHERAALSP